MLISKETTLEEATLQLGQFYQAAFADHQKFDRLGLDPNELPMVLPVFFHRFAKPQNRTYPHKPGS